ncbi:MAG: type IV toxin-antitoxin system AbiEi family antitoxin domain-containing protein [Clostridia bacterium]|nr:type IV toxin-antitoxin system AbiEi family antitoxin domain-containing protein [Clostridia bacterium]
MDIQKAKQIFDAHDGIMKAKEIQANKIYSHYLASLVKQGYVERIRHGYYQWQDERVFSEAVMIARLFPDAVLCRESALQYYGYTDRTPAAWCLAVDRGYTRSRFKLDYPLIRPAFFSQEQMQLGVDIVEIEGAMLQIFNREHIVCDCLRQENKMDAEVFNKAIQAYVKDPQKNIPRLMKYAKILRTEKKVRKIIGVWL